MGKNNILYRQKAAGHLIKTHVCKVLRFAIYSSGAIFTKPDVLGQDAAGWYQNIGAEACKISILLKLFIYVSIFSLHYIGQWRYDSKQGERGTDWESNQQSLARGPETTWEVFSLS